jgi:hypothetical protein
MGLKVSLTPGERWSGMFVITLGCTKEGEKDVVYW